MPDMPSYRHEVLSAAKLVCRRGDTASIFAAMRVDARLVVGDLQGYANWRSILSAIADISRDKPRPREKRH